VIQKLPHGLTEEQFAAYKAVVDMAQDSALLAKSTFGVRAIFLKALMHLKQICIHPEVFFSGEEDDYVFGTAERSADYAQVDERLHDHLHKMAQKFKVKGGAKDSVEAITSRSEKFAQLFEILEEAKETDKGILIFTQFRAAAQLVRKMLAASKTQGWENVPVLDGQLTTLQRMNMVDDFQAKTAQREQALADPNSPENSACPILILSLKAGGVGLNLTGASRVVHLDRWWNPAVEDQATDRAHRLGQKSTVFVNLLIANGTIEQSLDAILADKRLLSADILSANEDSVLSRETSNIEGFGRLVDPLGQFIKRSQQ
jgi:SNF2 family DNA or RNA helicase